jgi:ABC-2 type transport system ATP-binding protein
MTPHSPSTAASPREQPIHAADEWPALEVYDVSKRWAKDRPRVLDEVNLTVEQGSLVWIGGQNGVGKTTLLRVVSGLIGADSGEVRAFGLHPTRDRRQYQRRVAFLSAGNVGVYARLTVRGQMDIWARIAFVPRDRRAQLVDAVMTQFHLHELGDQRSDRLSMGQRQRLRIAMTFIGEPDLVLLDEPRTSLDIEGGDMLSTAIKGLAARGGAAIWVSPLGDPLPIEFDDNYVIENGKLRAV